MSSLVASCMSGSGRYYSGWADKRATVAGGAATVTSKSISSRSITAFFLGDVRLIDKHNDVGVITTAAKDFRALEFHHEEEDRMADPEACVGQTVLPNSRVRLQRLE